MNIFLHWLVIHIYIVNIYTREGGYIVYFY